MKTGVLRGSRFHLGRRRLARCGRAGRARLAAIDKFYLSVDQNIYFADFRLRASVDALSVAALAGVLVLFLALISGVRRGFRG